MAAPRAATAALPRRSPEASVLAPASMVMAIPTDGTRPRVLPMFRNRDRMVRYLVIFMAAMLAITLVMPFIAALGQ